MEIKRNKSWYIINWIAVILFFIALMFIFAESDKSITKDILKNNIVGNSQKFDDTFSAIGSTMLILPIFFAVSALIQRLLTTKGIKCKSALYWALISILVLICLVINFWTMIAKPHDRNRTVWITLIVFGFVYSGSMVLYEWFFWTKKSKDEVYINNQFWFGLRAVIYLVTIFVVVNVMKPIFGRPRPINVLKDNDKFQYPFAISVSTNPRRASFPSGHTISAMSIFAITLMFYTKPSWKKYSLNAFFAALVILVALSRILSLNHYTTDTFMSMGIGSFCYYWYSKLFNKFARN